MRGHDPIVAMRRKGVKPSNVWFNIATADDSWRDWLRTTHHGHAAVWIEPGDSIQLLDLRFVVGLQCFVHGVDEARTAALHEACHAAGAKRVLTTIFTPIDPAAAALGKRPRTVRMLDTASVFTEETA